MSLVKSRTNGGSNFAREVSQVLERWLKALLWTTTPCGGDVEALVFAAATLELPHEIRGRTEDCGSQQDVQPR
jgi:hypothetical protein